MVLFRAAPGRAQLGELGGDHPAVDRGVHLLVDVQDAPVEADEERPARRKRLVFVDDTVGGGDRLGRIAQQRIIESEFLRERLVGFGRIDADGK
jgi:hypothetical protein